VTSIFGGSFGCCRVSPESFFSGEVSTQAPSEVAVMTKHKKSLVPTPTKGKGGGKPGKVSLGWADYCNEQLVVRSIGLGDQ
jgi:hypothetical protein